jgi:hypothetical protein
MTSRIAGTRGYMAPEYLDHGIVSPKADVYALGIVMLELVTGKGVEDLVEWWVTASATRSLACASWPRSRTMTRCVPEAGVGPRGPRLAGGELPPGRRRQDGQARREVRPARRGGAAAAGISVVGWQGSQDPESPWSPSR